MNNTENAMSKLFINNHFNQRQLDANITHMPEHII